MYQQPGTLVEIAPQQAIVKPEKYSSVFPIRSNRIKRNTTTRGEREKNTKTTQHKLTVAAAGLGSSPVPHCSPHRAPDLPGDGGTPAGSISAPSCHSPGPGCACWSSQAVIEDSGGPGATSHTQARSRTSKDARFRMGTCLERKHREQKKKSTTVQSISFEPRR